MPSLLKTPLTFAFLLAVFLNAFIDLGHKIVIQNTVFKMHEGAEQLILTALVNSLILLPFILLFRPAGAVSDQFPKHRVMQLSAWAGLLLTLCITVCYALGWFWMAFFMTFLLAVQSTFYSPAKFAYLRGFFGKEHLAKANGDVAAISIMAILSGTFVFSFFFEMFFPVVASSKSVVIAQLLPLGVLLNVCAACEVALVYRLPNVDEVLAKGNAPLINDTVVQPVPSVRTSLAPIFKNSTITLSILGLAMFWSAGQVMLAAFPSFAKEVTGEKSALMVQLVIAASGLGLALGSFVASRASKNYIETGLVPIGAMGVAVGLLILPHLESMFLMGVSFFVVGFMGGIFIVPLNALIQFHASEHNVGKVLAGSNLIQNIAMLGFLILTVTFASLGISSKHLLILTAVFASLVGIYTVYALPQSLVRIVLSIIMAQRYRLNVQGMKNIPNTDGVLLLGNHISWIDWAIVQLSCPRKVKFVMLKSIYERWYLNWFFKLFGCIPISQSSGSRSSLKTVAALLDEGHVVCLFPEGGISRTGQLGEFKAGFEYIGTLAEKNYVVIPFYLRGLWESQWSRSNNGFKQANKGMWKRDVIMAFGDPKAKCINAGALKQCVFDLSVSSWQSYATALPCLAQGWVSRCKQRGNQLAISDTTTGAKLSNTTALAVAAAFAARIKHISPEQNMGILLPTSAGAVLTNMASLLCGKTVVNLNFSSSAAALASAVKQANIQTIYTSRLFLTKLKTKNIDFDEVLADVNVVLLEDMRAEISKTEFLARWLSVRLLPTWLLRYLMCQSSDTQQCAAILFSSGSEGEPKGVRLSHQNIMANVKQVAAVLNMRDNDTVMASLPLFHAFGLTVTQFLPLIEGMPMVCHPDPTDALGLSKAVAKHNATILFGTSTFLRLFCRNKKIQPMMLESLRLVIAGAERLKPEVRDAFVSKFGKPIFEGYGATETTPVASVNIPDALDLTTWQLQHGNREGTVGLPLPGTRFRIVDPDTFEPLPTGEDGMILIGGVQVMLGYLNNAEKTQEVIKNINDQRWYVTGDKGRMDEDGFLTIVDRYSRFAKIGGEMISLSAVERAVIDSMSHVWPDLDVVAVNVPDDKKGERIVILSDVDINISELKQALLACKVNPLMLPAKWTVVDALPKLGTGKTDFSLAKILANNH